MSYRDPGESYVPPPPPKPKRSPWMFVGIGCGVLALLVVGVFGLLAYQIQQEIKNNPFDAQKNRIAMGDTPVFPGSELDDEMTQAQYAGLKIGGMFGNLKADKVTCETRLTSESVDDIQDYYWKIMTSRRYKSIPQPEIAGARAVLYRKDNDALMVQVQAVPKFGGNAIILMRFWNFRDEIGEDVEEPPAVGLEAVDIPAEEMKPKTVPVPENKKADDQEAGK